MVSHLRAYVSLCGVFAAVIACSSEPIDRMPSESSVETEHVACTLLDHFPPLDGIEEITCTDNGSSDLAVLLWDINHDDLLFQENLAVKVIEIAEQWNINIIGTEGFEGTFDERICSKDDPRASSVSTLKMEGRTVVGLEDGVGNLYSVLDGALGILNDMVLSRFEKIGDCCTSYDSKFVECRTVSKVLLENCHGSDVQTCYEKSYASQLTCETDLRKEIEDVCQPLQYENFDELMLLTHDLEALTDRIYKVPVLVFWDPPYGKCGGYLWLSDDVFDVRRDLLWSFRSYAAVDAMINNMRTEEREVMLGIYGAGHQDQIDGYLDYLGISHIDIFVEKDLDTSPTFEMQLFSEDMLRLYDTRLTQGHLEVSPGERDAIFAELQKHVE